MKKKIAFISDHASPLATLGGVDSGGQNVYVAELPKHLTELGYEIDIFTRKESSIDTVINWQPGIRVIHIKAGPVAIIAKEELLCYMDEFTSNMAQFIAQENICYDLIHANFFMSALVASPFERKVRNSLYRYFPMRWVWCGNCIRKRWINFLPAAFLSRKQLFGMRTN